MEAADFWTNVACIAVIGTVIVLVIVAVKEITLAVIDRIK